MKVGTDGVLLGAWAPVDGVRSVLDVGAGTGLISLMVVQRNPEANVVAVEIDQAAAAQAWENVQRSPWSDRVEVVCQDFSTFTSSVPFDLIVSNPPYFVDALKCPDRQRSTARHADSLNYDLLFRRSKQLLVDDGILSLVLPAELESQVIDTAWTHGFWLQHLTHVYSKPGKAFRRSLLSFVKSYSQISRNDLYIASETNEYTAEYKALTGDFYLKL